MTNVTVFKNVDDVLNPYTVSLERVLDRIRTGASKDKVELIRLKCVNGEDYDDDKKGLPCVVFSANKVQKVISKKGYETFREDASVLEHSGVFTLDWDSCDVRLKLQQLKKDPYIFAAWLSPTATGIRALVKCPPSVEYHDQYYTAFLDRYPELDSTSRNIARVAFESYDENIYINSKSLVWDKKLTKEESKKNKEREANRRGSRVISTAVAMIRSSYDGNKHDSLRDAAVLLGGYIATGRVDENDAVKVLEEEIRLKNPKDMDNAKQTILDGISYGKSRPLIESKKIEKAQRFLRREDGTYDFIADNQEMTEYELAVINGTLEMGLPTGFNELNEHWMFKKHTLVWFGALDNVGKSFFVWYLSVLAAKLHNWKIVINSNENSDGELRKKLKEFYIGKSIKLMDAEELTKAHDFVKDHYRIITSKQMNSVEDWLLKAEILYDEGFEFQVVIGDPFNSYEVPNSMDLYRHDINSLNLMRIFKENYASIWMTDHVNSMAARKKDKDGFIEVPWKSDINQGQIKANKVDDFIILHRIINHPFKRNQLEVHVNKIKSIETGGFPTTKDMPVIISLNDDYCGFNINRIDPIKLTMI